MSLSLCNVYRRIPESFFSRKHGKYEMMQPASVHTRTTIHRMQRCAESSCSLCVVLMAHANTSFLPEHAIRHAAIEVKRALIDPEMSFQLYVGLDDFSRTHFFRVPPEWKHSRPAKLYEPCDVLPLMQTWISNCESKHPKCRQDGCRILPKRLLDVRPFTSSEDIKLVLSLGLSSTTKYAALSHCWGPSARHPICTKKATLSDRMQRIRSGDLSVTFRDAVNACRDLNLPYLWIDSLCIIQDDEYDWKEQAQTMATIYNGATLTLAALSSSDSTEGCRIRPRDPKKPKISRHQDFMFGSQRIRISEDRPTQWHVEYGDNPYKHEHYGNNPLRTRDWTLQERELSRRSIHFSQGQLLWQCQKMKGCSELPWHEMARDHDDFLPKPLRLYHGESFSPSGSAYRRDRWYGLVEDFSSRYLTAENDKLPAFAGLAVNFYSERASGQYFAGIWSSHLPSALLWRTFPFRRVQSGLTNPLGAFQPRRPQGHRPPSWSWASIDGEVSYESQRSQDDQQDEKIDTDHGAFEVAGMQDQSTMTFNPMGAMSHLFLQVRGHIAEVKFELKALEGVGLEGPWPLVREDNTTIGAIYLDIPDDFQFLQSVVPLNIRSEPYFSSVQMPDLLYGAKCDTSDQTAWVENDLRMGLALLPVKVGGCYRRVGLVRWMIKEIFEDTPVVDLTIV